MKRSALAAAACAAAVLAPAPVAAQVDSSPPTAIVSGTSAATPASARQTSRAPDAWEFSFVPLYFWATELDGQLAAGPATIPIFLEFADAADNLGGAFSFHFEAARGRWGFMTDLNYIRLSSSAPIAVGALTIEREFQLDNLMFEAVASYLLSRPARLALIGGLRTYTLSPTIEFSGSAASVAPIDDSETSADGFVGFTVRPRFNEKWAFIGRADVGGGNADLTWSAVAGLEFRFKPWGSIDFGYKALGIDVKDEARTVREYDVTHYGPIFGLRMHWTK